MSQNAQLTTLGMYTSCSAPGFVFPVPRSTKDSRGSVSLKDAGEVEQFYLATVSAVREVLESGMALKELVNAAGTIDQVKAVIDDR